MGHTATEKILAQHAGVKEVFPGDVVTCDVDLVFAHSPWMITPYWEKMGKVTRVFDGDKVAFGLGHHVCLPASEKYAEDLVESRQIVKKYGIKHCYDMGTGNGHILMLEKGHVYPGGLFIGADSHATIYGAVGGFGTALSYEVPEILLNGRAWFKVPKTMRVNMDSATQKGVCARDVVQYLMDVVGAEGALWRTLEFGGSYTHNLSVYQRYIFSLMAVEMGSVTGFIEPDEISMEFCRRRARYPFTPVMNDADCVYEKEWEIDVSKIEPMIGCPPRPSNTKTVAEVERENIKIDQAFIGGCTGSSLEDFRMAAEILRGRKIHPDVRLVIVPGTAEILLEMSKEGLTQFFESIGAIVSPPYCGPCQMMCYGFLGDGETMIGTHPRNQPGRAGTASVFTYLASPYTVAASAVAGKIVDPRRYL